MVVLERYANYSWFDIPFFSRLNQWTFWRKALPSLEWTSISLRSTPHPVTATIRIITYLVGNSYKPSFATVTGWGVDPTYPLPYRTFESMSRCSFPFMKKYTEHPFQPIGSTFEDYDFFTFPNFGREFLLTFLNSFTLIPYTLEIEGTRNGHWIINAGPWLIAILYITGCRWCSVEGSEIYGALGASKILIIPNHNVESNLEKNNPSLPSVRLSKNYPKVIVQPQHCITKNCRYLKWRYWTL